MIVQDKALRTIDEDTFIERFRPKPNHLDFTGGFDFGDGCCLFSSVRQGRQIRARPKAEHDLDRGRG